MNAGGDHEGPRRGAWRPLPTQNTAPTSLRTSLDKLASTLGLTSVDSVNALFLEWPEIVGSDLANHCKPRRLTDGVLTVQASDPQWATELGWMTTLLVERCCEALGEGAVVRVRITQ